MHRLDEITQAGLYTGISWYADYPEQIAGDPSNASKERGVWINERNVQRLVNSIKIVKEDEKALFLLKEYYGKHKKIESK